MDFVGLFVLIGVEVLIEIIFIVEIILELFDVFLFMVIEMDLILLVVGLLFGFFVLMWIWLIVILYWFINFFFIFVFIWIVICFKIYVCCEVCIFFFWFFIEFFICWLDWIDDKLSDFSIWLIFILKIWKMGVIIINIKRSLIISFVYFWKLELGNSKLIMVVNKIKRMILVIYVVKVCNFFILLLLWCCLL